MRKLVRAMVITGIAIAVSVGTVGLYELLPRAPSPSEDCASGLTVSQAIPAGPIAFGASLDAAIGPNHWYNFSVEYASPRLALSAIWFELKSPNGTTLFLPTGGLAIVTLGPSTSVSLEAIFSFGGGWTYESGFGPSTFLSTDNVLSLFYSGSTPDSLVGDTLFAADCVGTVSGPVS